ncbi:MAG: hypothetical protein K6C10_01595 [Prevotella sp.]|nr:hypothetical protein [Prevotella sp.]
MKQILIASFLTISLICQAQNWDWVSNQVNVENNADPNKALVYDLWKSFLDAHNDSTTIFPQWNEKDKMRWKQPDLISSEGFLNANLYSYLNKVLEIRPENDAYIIRSMFYTPFNDDKAIFVLAITNHVVKRDEKGEFKIYNWVDYHTRNWQHQTVGHIDYCYYPSFHFDETKAMAANKLINLLHDKLGVNLPERITQFIAPNLYEQQKLKGFDYLIGMGDEQGNSGGSFDRKNFIIYGDSVHGENYQHEIARLINPTYPDAHFLFIQGIAEYVNTSQKQFGLSHREHYGRMKVWLNAHPDADLTDLDDKFYTMDNQTAPSYLVGKIVCYELFKRGGFQALKRALDSGEEDADFYGFLKKEIGISKVNFNHWLREKIDLYSKEDIPPLQ